MGDEPVCDRHARGALAWVERHFLHPRLGLPYDYFSPAGGCPRRSFGTARDARQNLPNTHGFGAGFALSTQNLALLLDAVLLRLELGIAGPSEETLADHLADGLLRLATAAPRHALVRGLAGDGRSYYAGIDAAVTIAFAHAVRRCLASPVTLPEKQDKLRQAALDWIMRLEAENYRLNTPDGRPLPDADLTTPADPFRGPWLLALAGFAAWIAPSPERTKRYADYADADYGARCADPTPRIVPAAGEPVDAPVDADDASDPWTGVWRQYARRLASELDPDEERRKRLAATLPNAGRRMAARAASWREFDPEKHPTLPDGEWRSAPRPVEGPGPRDFGAPGSGGWSEKRTGFAAPESWARLLHENDTLRTGLSGMLGLVLSGDKEAAAELAEPFTELLERVAWNQAQTCAAPALALTIHAYGVELGLWDAGLPESRRVTSAKTESFAARFLEDDYDERHPEQAGPGDPAPEPEKAEGESGGRHRNRRRRRRK